jgi:hypothetical protein
MARLMLIGQVAVELTSDPVDGGMIARCLSAGCDWTEVYDTTDDATEYAQDHADRPPCQRPVGNLGQALKELAELEDRDRAAGGPPWEVPDHPDHDLPGGWHRGQIT